MLASGCDGAPGATFASGGNNIPLEVLDDLESSLLDVSHGLAVGEFTEEARGSDDEIDTVDTSAARVSLLAFSSGHLHSSFWW